MFDLAEISETVAELKGSVIGNRPGRVLFSSDQINLFAGGVNSDEFIWNLLRTSTKLLFALVSSTAVLLLHPAFHFYQETLDS